MSTSHATTTRKGEASRKPTARPPVGRAHPRAVVAAGARDSLVPERGYYTAADVMTTRPRTIEDSVPLREAVELIHTLEVRHLPVVDEEGNLVGMLSDRDLGALSLPFVLDGELAGTVRDRMAEPVSAIMTGHVVSVDTETDLGDIIDLLLEQKVGALPVVDGDGELRGIVSYVDVLRQLRARL